jgi:Spy/CpxP family protein refolding chaperone
MKKTLLILAVTLFSLSTFAGGGRHHKDKFEKLIRKLELTEDQIQKIKDHRKGMKEANVSLRKSKNELKQKIQNAFIDGKSDSELEVLHKQLVELKQKKMDLKFKKLVFFKSVLNKDQREKFIEFKNKRKKRRWKKHYKED